MKKNFKEGLIAIAIYVGIATSMLRVVFFGYPSALESFVIGVVCVAVVLTIVTKEIVREIKRG